MLESDQARRCNLRNGLAIDPKAGWRNKDSVAVAGTGRSGRFPKTVAAVVKIETHPLLSMLIRFCPCSRKCYASRIHQLTAEQAAGKATSLGMSRSEIRRECLDVSGNGS
jgi:hypothetical protein